MERQFDQDPQWLNRLMKEDDGLNVPPDYFDTFEDRLMQRIADHDIRRPALQQVPKARRVTMRRQWMAAAAAVTLIAAAVWFFRAAPQPVEAPVASVELSDEDIESFLLDNVQDFEAEQLAMLPEEEPQREPEHAPSTPAGDSLNDITPDDVNSILNDMTEEELEDIL